VPAAPVTLMCSDPAQSRMHKSRVLVHPVHLPAVPDLLSHCCSPSYLPAGKYLNTIRECGQQVVRPLPADVHLQYDPHGLFQHHIGSAYRAASEALLHFMLQEQQLLQLMASIKHFFLLDQVGAAGGQQGQPEHACMQSTLAYVQSSLAAASSKPC
jgi:hypothetical protein